MEMKFTKISRTSFLHVICSPETNLKEKKLIMNRMNVFRGKDHKLI